MKSLSSTGHNFQKENGSYCNRRCNTAALFGVLLPEQRAFLNIKPDLCKGTGVCCQVSSQLLDLRVENRVISANTKVGKLGTIKVNLVIWKLRLQTINSVTDDGSAFV